MNHLHKTLTTIFFIVLILAMNDIISRSGGAPDGRTGAPGDMTCQNGCHNSFDLNSGPGSTNITSNIPETGYISGETYTINLIVKHSGRTKYGFGALAYGVTANDGIGTVSLTDSTRTQLNVAGNKQYLTHTSEGNTQSQDSALWSFDWTAPEIGTGDISIHAAFVAASNSDGNKEDYVYTDTLSISESLTNSIRKLIGIPEISIFPTLVEENIFIELSAQRTTDFEIKVIDSQGKQLYHLNQNLQIGKNDFSVNASTWPKGVYYLLLRSDASTAVEKVIRF